ncbi:hypothetical protein HDU88_004433 [Geranomyces variabilis]|nr:hypothetical protein HDU88_004433 [Geranomyces variabilis]
MTTILPNQTLYIKGLDDKIQKEELRRSLYYLFSQHGSILDVVALKTQKMRGQAFVVFRDITDATTAMRALQGFPFYSKTMNISYAKGKSNVVQMKEGVYVGASQPSAPAGPTAEPAPSGTKRPNEAEDAGGAKRTKGDDAADDAEPDSTTDTAAVASRTENQPNRILFLSNLPESVSEDALAMLFQEYPGFKEVRLVPGKTGIAFVEYETDIQADTAKGVLNGFKLAPTVEMGVEFAKM